MKLAERLRTTPLEPSNDVMAPAEIPQLTDNLNRALSSGQTMDGAVALFDLKNALDGDVRNFDFGYNIRLADMLEILSKADLHLQVREDDRYL